MLWMCQLFVTMWLLFLTMWLALWIWSTSGYDSPSYDRWNDNWDEWSEHRRARMNDLHWGGEWIGHQSVQNWENWEHPRTTWATNDYYQ